MDKRGRTTKAPTIGPSTDRGADEFGRHDRRIRIVEVHSQIVGENEWMSPLNIAFLSRGAWRSGSPRP
jgi:hypothetical protein